MGALRSYGDGLAVVTVERRGARIVAADGPPTELRLAEELGRPAVVNRVVAGLPEEIGWVAVVDPGVALAPGALDRLRAAAVPRAGLLGPLLRDPTRRQINSCGSRPAFGALLRGRVLARPVAAGPTGWLDGRCVLIRRLAWDSVDGYDSRHIGTGDPPRARRRRPRRPARPRGLARPRRARGGGGRSPDRRTGHPGRPRPREPRPGPAPVCPRPLPRARPGSDGAGPPGLGPV